MTRPMDPLFDERIAEWLGGEPDTAPGEALEVVLTTFPSVPQQRVAHRVPRRLPTMPTPIRFAAAAVVGVLAIGGALYVTRPGQPAVAGPGLMASASASPSRAAVVAPRATPLATPTPTPSPTPTPILWTKASLQEDWPAPVRAEPVGGSILVPFLVGEDGPGEYLDPSGDTESAVFPWVDIREVRVSTNLYIHPVSSPPFRVDPTEQWIAYGIVFDEDRDGVPDWRYGMDNRPVAKDDDQGIRAWRTDLHTGRTETAPPYYNGVAGVVLDTYWDYNDMGATFVFGGEVTGGGTAGKKMDVPFYVWASVIQDGRVVATDYAPDAGWLDPGHTSSPDPTTLSDPTPPPGRVVDDPDVPGGRLWTVTVVNTSPKPATLFVAEEDSNAKNDMGRLVGTVTPSIVPAGATVDVTFAIPRGDGWAIFVNPGPDTGPLIIGSQTLPAGGIRILEDGNAGWVGV